jgi:hypothetical protein
MFAGSSHQNYTTYLLEVYCFLRYEASKDLRDGVLNNWLVNITGELGKWIEGDLLQEHYNRWLEDQVQKRGGDFDDKFYRSTLSPNVNHFLRIKEEIENAFDLSSRAKTHTSPHLRAELRLLLELFKEEFLHLFCTGRTLGHAAGNQLNHGFNRLQIAKLADFTCKTTPYADVLADILAYKQANELERDAPHAEEGVQQPVSAGNDIDIHPPSSDISSSSESGTSGPEPSGSSSSSSLSSSHFSDDIEEDDPSNNHLVSGSEYDVHISEDGLTHRAWYEQEDEEGNSSDESDSEGKDFDVPLFSDEENGQDDQDSYDSD